jgi:hypothetical protein
MYRKFAAIESNATALGVAEFQPNSAYDVDPSLGSTETYGFDEYAALYSYYRVIAYEYEVTVVPGVNYASPLMCYLINSNTRPSSSGTRYDLYSTNPYCQSDLIQPSLGKAVFRGRVDISKLLGSLSIETDDNYRSLTTGSPTDLVWLAVAAETASGSVGISFAYDVKLVMHVRFYGRELDLSLNALASRANERLLKRKQDEMAKAKSHAAKETDGQNPLRVANRNGTFRAGM